MKPEEMLNYLEGTDLSEDTKTAICKLIQANNAQLKKDMPEVISKSIESDMKRRGMRF